jgi:lysophospholipase L1-like esterase
VTALGSAAAHWPALRYVALGDSYTIGTAVRAADRWPDLLVARLRDLVPDGTLDLAANLAVNGWTSGDVLDRQLPGAAALAPEFVSLLVGVNDVIRATAVDVYRANVEAILDQLIPLVGAHRILCVETPDYTHTPKGGDYGPPAERRAQIATVNAVLASVARERGILSIDGITAISAAAAADPTLVADDGLHPSGRQYRRWVEERIAPAVQTLLERPFGYPPAGLSRTG